VLNKGQSITDYYRLMTGGGGYIWIQTVASVICNSKNIDEMNIVAINYVIRYDPSIRLAVCLCISMSLSLPPSFLYPLNPFLYPSPTFLHDVHLNPFLRSFLPLIPSFSNFPSHPLSFLTSLLSSRLSSFLTLLRSFIHLSIALLTCHLRSLRCAK